MVKHKLLHILSDAKAACSMLAHGDSDFKLLCSLHRLKTSPSLQANLAIKFGIPAAAITGLLVGGSHANISAMQENSKHAKHTDTYIL